MEAIRQIVKVKNNKITITLPEDFNSEEVEVIILSTNDKNYTIPQSQIDQVKERSSEYHKNPNAVTKIEEFLNESDSNFVLSNEQIKILEERSNRDNSTFISAEESIARLKRRQRV